MLIVMGKNLRLDKFLTERLPEHSRSFWQRLIKSGKIAVNGKCVKPSYVLRGGEKIVIELPPPESEIPQPEELPLDIIFEDDQILVINKPPGLVVHPGAGRKEHTLVNAILHHCPGIELSGSAQRPGIVHRLDKDTSGIMVVTKTHQAYFSLVQQISRRQARRRYKALVIGEPIPTEGEINLPIGRHRLHRTKIAVNLITGKPATTHYKTIERFLGLSLLEVSLQTGRTHQIRVHLAHIGHPVLGDQQYGVRAKALISRLPPQIPTEVKDLLLSVKRQMLHSYYLKLKHPLTAEEVEFTAPLAKDFAELLASLRQYCSPK